MYSVIVMEFLLLIKKFLKKKKKRNVTASCVVVYLFNALVSLVPNFSLGILGFALVSVYFSI